MPVFTNIDGEESATVTFRVGSVQMARGTTNEEQEIICLGDPDSSNALAAVTNAAPASTRWGLNVRLAGGPSSVADVAIAVQPVAGSTFAVRPLQSSAADLQVTATPAAGSTFNVRALQSSAADLNVTVAGYSTTVNVSSLAGAVIVRSSAADAIVTVKNSTIAELLASVQQNSTVWQTQAKIQDSSAVTFVGSTGRPSTGVQGLATRLVLNDLQSTGRSTVGATSTRTELVSSAASVRVKVFAYSITSTVVTPSTCAFYSSNAQLLWPINLGSASSGITGANLAVTPPAWIFATESAAALNFVTPSSVAEFHVGISYFVEA